MRGHPRTPFEKGQISPLVATLRRFFEFRFRIESVFARNSIHSPRTFLAHSVHQRDPPAGCGPPPAAAHVASSLINPPRGQPKRAPAGRRVPSPTRDSYVGDFRGFRFPTPAPLRCL